PAQSRDWPLGPWHLDCLGLQPLTVCCDDDGKSFSPHGELDSTCFRVHCPDAHYRFRRDGVQMGIHRNRWTVVLGSPLPPFTRYCRQMPAAGRPPWIRSLGPRPSSGVGAVAFSSRHSAAGASGIVLGQGHFGTSFFVFGGRFSDKCLVT